MSPLPRRSAATRAALAAAALLAFAGFIWLGNWQLERRAWKLELIARVEQRVHAAPVPAPGPDEWPRVTAARDEYRRVRAAGTFLRDRDTLVQALTALGSGYWLLTPLQTADGSTVLVNRGFVPPERRVQAAPGDAVITGLLRITEPGGTLLRRNDPASDRWYSRDVQAIASARGLDNVAPYFIDADASSSPRGGPVGGLTVTDFRNQHLSYALTWYALALMVAVAAGYVALTEVRR